MGRYYEKKIKEREERRGDKKITEEEWQCNVVINSSPNLPLLIGWY